MMKKTENIYRTRSFTLPDICGNIAKLLVSAVAILHLIISPVHVTGLLLLENLICGFVMFLFILLGLLALFNALRTKEGQVVSMIAEIAILAVVIVVGVILSSIYIDAIRNQATLSDVASVQKALILSIVVCSLYGVGILLYLIDIIGEFQDGKYVRK